MPSYLSYVLFVFWQIYTVDFLSSLVSHRGFFLSCYLGASLFNCLFFLLLLICHYSALCSIKLHWEQRRHNNQYRSVIFLFVIFAHIGYLEISPSSASLVCDPHISNVLLSTSRRDFDNPTTDTGQTFIPLSRFLLQSFRFSKTKQKIIIVILFPFISVV